MGISAFNETLLKFTLACLDYNIGQYMEEHWTNIKHCNLVKSVQKFSFAQYWAANIAKNVGVLSISQTLVNDGTLGNAAWVPPLEKFSKKFQSQKFEKPH